MSRVGKMPVAVPQGVDVTINSSQISVKGTGGTLSMAASALVSVANNAGSVSLDRKSTRLNSSHSQQSRMPSSA